MAKQLLSQFVHLIATVSPGAKLGSTSPYYYANMVMVEMAKSPPRSLANAFLKPVPSYPDPLENAYKALVKHVQELDGMYGRPPYRNLMAIGQGAPELQTILSEEEPRLESISDLASWMVTRD